MAVWAVLRVVLFLAFPPAGLSPAETALALAVGLHRDVFAALLYALPLLACFMILPDSLWERRVVRLGFWGGVALFWAVQIFLLFVEFFFFDEFRSRFNTVAVDYLIYPHEVFVNIWESYHAGWIIFGSLAAGTAVAAASRKMFAPAWRRPCGSAARLGWFAAVGAGWLLLLPTIHLRPPAISAERSLNQIADNGTVAFLAAAWSGNLDYAAFYPTLPPDEAYARARRLLTQPGTEFVESGNSIRRRLAGDPARPRLNVVILLEESMGSEFWGSLGARFSFTPEMDRLAEAEGWLFTNLYASGNRTVRGMEGVLASFPPLPGDSVVKRSLSDQVETVARALRRDGYATLFVYGGRGLFDRMRSFALRNGYERFLEQKDFARPTFATAWGVCDEDIFDRALAEMRQMQAAGKPFLVTTLSVSNHKPFTYPRGRIAENPDDKVREYAVKYSDYALGRFFAQARREPFWTNTIFAVVADHGARVYGEQTIPIHSYSIPLLILGPAVVDQPRRYDPLGGSLDVAPTLLGLIGRPRETIFFGRDLLRSSGPGFAPLQHNRDIGILTDDRLAVLGLMRQEEVYAGDPRTGKMSRLNHFGPAERELLRDTAALYQVADDLYLHRAYHLEAPERPAPP